MIESQVKIETSLLKKNYENIRQCCDLHYLKLFYGEKIFCFLKLNVTCSLNTVLWKNVALTFIFKFWAEKDFYLLQWVHIIEFFLNITIPLHSFFFNCWYSYNNDITRFILTRSRWFISRLQPYFPKFLWVLRTMPAHLSSPFIFYRTVSSNSRSLQQRFESFKIIMPK